MAAQPTNATISQEVTEVSPVTWEAIGTGGITQPFTPVTGQTALKGANGRPELLYIGGGYYPNCAAERWSLLNALSRFGTFTQVSQIQSNEGDIATFSFRGSSYQSQYLDFVPLQVDVRAAIAVAQGLPAEPVRIRAMPVGVGAGTGWGGIWTGRVWRSGAKPLACSDTAIIHCPVIEKQICTR